MENITIEELKKKQENKEEINLLDVREHDERQAYNIGGRHLPLGKIQQMDLETINDWKDKNVVIYCRSGKRSMMAALFLQQAGFKHVFNLTGGVEEWKKHE